MKTGIIIPCYNEAKRLNTKAFAEFANNHNDFHICFVNDGSSDNTLEVLESVEKCSPENISVIDVKINAGKAAAVRSGVKYLQQFEDVSYVGFIDADLSTDFEDFKNLVKTLKSNEDLTFVYGSRGKGEGEIERNFFRNVFSKIIKSIVFLILGLPIEDTQCGAKVFKKEIINIAYGRTFLTRWLFDVEIFIRLKEYYGSKEVMTKIYEQPLTRWVHVDDSKLGMKDAIQIPYKLLSIWFSYSVLNLSAS
ncbi:glycosyltransferase [Wenyingzhuangia sp. 2_MG-2023]|uniref:glycosyltransferase n=1 Tax=Wenyingzhuangia sp. 2_MG-2023 TaxID=3062639 RepID=UPI0026E16D89|nr:glycosyltransferase [Wenyingzhuangia sp. 2_MG-2023]MDO6738188.1 glycosyltransferase [Wenyingzhuangia sp. 2_MG-2023]MDO6801488.1 glycosyltransferase [Wenyingzhuangia sp. 1_MG-2023]